MKYVFVRHTDDIKEEDDDDEYHCQWVSHLEVIMEYVMKYVFVKHNSAIKEGQSQGDNV